MADTEDQGLFSVEESEHSHSDRVDAPSRRPGVSPPDRYTSAVVPGADRAVLEPGDPAAGRSGRDAGTGAGEQAVQSWTQQHHSQPDHATTVGLHETALQNAREAIVRQSLYDLIPQPPEGHDSKPPTPADIPWTHRWRHLVYRAEPSEQIEELADHLWPDRSAMFRVKAAYLLATRLEENRVIPTAPGHRLTHDLGVEVAEAMTAEGYPPE